MSETKSGFNKSSTQIHHNNPVDYLGRINDDQRSSYEDASLSTTRLTYQATILSDTGEYGGFRKVIIPDPVRGQVVYNSFEIRFDKESSQGREAKNYPHRLFEDPLMADDLEGFKARKRTQNTRAVCEQGSFIGELLMGTIDVGSIVKVRKEGEIYYIIENTKRVDEKFTNFVNRISGKSKPTKGSDSFKNNNNQTSPPGAHANSPYSSERKTSTVSKGGVPKTIANPASNCDVPIEGRALLDMIAYNESRGSYNIRYGGDQAIEITDFSDHPRKAERITRGYNTGKKSSAAGRYQFITSTWDDISKQEGITDFTPESQDRAAYALAVRDYEARNPGRDLLKDLQSGTPEDLNRIGRSLSQTWTSLPGSTSGEQLTSDSQFVEGYNNLLEKQKELNNCKKSFT